MERAGAVGLGMSTDAVQAGTTDGQEMTQATELELRQVDPARRRALRYYMTRCRSLFGEVALLIAWGRIGKPARVRLETFQSETELDERWRALVARRNAHGYQSCV